MTHYRTGLILKYALTLAVVSTGLKRIKENCSCGRCKYKQTIVILFQIYYVSNQHGYISFSLNTKLFRKVKLFLATAYCRNVWRTCCCRGKVRLFGGASLSCPRIVVVFGLLQVGKCVTRWKRLGLLVLKFVAFLFVLWISALIFIALIFKVVFLWPKISMTFWSSASRKEMTLLRLHIFVNVHPKSLKVHIWHLVQTACVTAKDWQTMYTVA